MERDNNHLLHIQRVKDNILMYIIARKQLVIFIERDSHRLYTPKILFVHCHPSCEVIRM